MELWDLYTRERIKTGIDHIRGEKIPDGYFHLVVHVWIRNNRGEYMISQRSKTRPTFPLMWECVGGSVLKGEDSLDGALRETMEEVGVDLSFCPRRLIKSEVREHFHDIMDVWLFDYNGQPSLDNAETDEVAQFKWMTAEQIKELYDAGELVKTLSYFFSEVCSLPLSR